MITLSEQWNDALARKDIVTVEHVLAADFYVSAAGALRKTEKSVWLKNVEEMDWNSLKMAMPDGGAAPRRSFYRKLPSAARWIYRRLGTMLHKLLTAETQETICRKEIV